MISRIGKRIPLKSKGFTFIELVLVSIIILVLVGITAPQFRGPFHRIQLKNTCQSLVQLMRYIQGKSIAEKKFCRINFDFEQGTFWPTVEDEAHPGKFVRIKGKWGKTFKTTEGVSINALEDIPINEETSFITFYPDGTSDKAKIKISGSKGKAFTITTQRTIRYAETEE